MRIKDLVAESHDRAVRKGWYSNGPRPIPELLCLIHSEISEALECYRNGEPHLHYDEKGKPLGLAIELADTIIRVADMCGALGIDLEHAIEIKNHWNELRPNRHGGKVA